MKTKSRIAECDVQRMELKYCERCGGLWLRASGEGMVYCEKCQPLVAELPPPKKRPGRIGLPVGPVPVVDEYEDEELESSAAGGVA